MIGQQAYLYNKNNRLIDAAITATIAASQRTPLVYPVSKAGTGNIAITGNYFGSVDSEYEVIISDTSFTAPVVSSPVFRGAGTGKIKDIAVAGLAAQKITILLQSTGVTTQRAEAEIEGEPFEAIAEGDEGNAISISIDNSEIISTLTAYSTLKDLKVGDTGLTGQEWDFDTKSILGNIVPDTAHRIRFGDNLLHIYRQYKKFEDGAYKYYFIPPIKYDVKAGSKVYFVTEGRTVTVSDEVTDEEYIDIITIADFWTAVKTTPSAIIRPKNSSIDTSKTPDSPSVRELSVMTDAYALPSYAGDNSSEFAGVVESVVVTDLTKTELISIECIDNTFIGEELWDVKGSSSGALGQVKTGAFNGVGPVGFAVPQRFPKDWDTRLNENWSSKVDYATREEEIIPPPICISFKQGAKSIAQTLQLEYTLKPVDCACPVISFEDIYLGFEKEGGEKGMAYTIPDLNFWMDALKATMAERMSYTEVWEDMAVTADYFAKYNILFKALAARLMSLPEDAPVDLAAMLADFKQLVNGVYVRSTNASNLAPPEWIAESVASATVIPTIPNGYAYSKDAIGAMTGDSGATEPAWPATGPVDDAQIHWTRFKTHTRWASETLMSGEALPTVNNGFVYQANAGPEASGTSGVAEPYWPLVIGQTVDDTELVWAFEVAYVKWQALSFHYYGSLLVPTFANAGFVYEVIDEGTSAKTGATEPVWPDVIGATVIDGTITWRCKSALPEWTAETTYALGDVVRPTEPAIYHYQFIVSEVKKITGVTEPTWPIVIGETVTDETIIWTCLRALDEWVAENTYTTADRVCPTVIEDSNKEYIATILSITGTTEPIWPTELNETVTDGTTVWRCYATTDLFEEAATAVAGKFYQPSTPNGYWYLCLTGGTMSGTEPDWPEIKNTRVSDGSIVFVCQGKLLDNAYILYRWDGKAWVYGWDGLSELTPFPLSMYSVDISYNTELYQKIVDAILLYEITYGLKKNSLNLTGDVPYIQGDAEYYWKFISGDKQYLPAFTDIPYYSVINACGCGYDYIGTKEFGLNISVPCGGTLLAGDKITIIITGQAEHTYLLGDKTFLPTVAASDLNFVGGIDGDDTYTFEVAGDVNTFADYLLDRDAPLPYKGTLAAAWQAGHSYSPTNYVKAVTFNGYRYECTTGGTSGSTAPTWPTTIGATVNDNGVVWTCRACELLLEITDGIVPFSVGDSFEFNIEGGHFKWRKDGGAWSSAVSLSVAAQSIAEGLSVAFVFGVSPSFVVDDQWKVLCMQENKASNLTLPWDQITKGTNSIVFACASPIAVNALVIDGHTLTGTVKFQASNVSNFTTLIHDETLTIIDLICNLYSTAITAQYFRLYMTGAYTIGYMFIGSMMRLGSDADSVVPLKRYSMSRQDGKKPFSLYNYQSKGFNIQYNTFIDHADYLLLDEMIQYLKELNDMPFYLVPNINYPADCMKGRIDTDNQEPGSDIDYNVPPANRIYTLNLPVMSA